MLKGRGREEPQTRRFDLTLRRTRSISAGLLCAIRNSCARWKSGRSSLAHLTENHLVVGAGRAGVGREREPPASAGGVEGEVRHLKVATESAGNRVAPHRAASCMRIVRITCEQHESHMRTAAIVGFFWRKTSSVGRHRVGWVHCRFIVESSSRSVPKDRRTNPCEDTDC